MFTGLVAGSDAGLATRPVRGGPVSSRVGCLLGINRVRLAAGRDNYETVVARYIQTELSQGY